MPFTKATRIIIGAKTQIAKTLTPTIKTIPKDKIPTIMSMDRIKNPIIRIMVFTIIVEKKLSIPPDFSSLILFHGENKVLNIVEIEKKCKQSQKKSRQIRKKSTSALV